MTRWAAFPAALAVPLFLLASCTGEAPAPAELALPTLADDSLERDCACLERGECMTPEAFEGQGETRNFQCRRDGVAGRATCTYESRFKQPAAGARWSSWGRTTVRFRHLGERGWCSFERSSENELSR